MKIPARLYVLCKADRGASLVELALVTPFLLLLFVGAIDFGRAYYVGLQVANAAHAGAEYGSLYPTVKADIQNAAINAVPNLTLASTPVVTWGSECSDGSSYTASSSTPSPACVANGTRSSTSIHVVTVTTSAVYKMMVPWAFIPAPYNFAGPSTITFTRSATIRGN
jgi:Flp pilus assembly protein TadG